MKIYPSYESTNDRFWNNDIPSNWGMKRIGSVFTQRNEKVSDTDYEPLSVTKKGIFPQWENVSKSDSHDDRKLVLKNDFVINSRSDRRGSSGLSKLDGSVSLINTVLTPSNEVEPKYSEYIFKSYEFINEFYKNGRGIVDDLWSTKYSLMKNIYICIPPLPEQTQIVSFLDTKTQKIDDLIHKTEKKIELLKEKRTSLINHCVTKGLNPNVEMKDSGVEWIGEIPSEWVVVKIKWISKLVTDGSHFSPLTTDKGKFYVTVSDVTKDNKIDFNNCKKISIESFDGLQKNGCQPNVGDVLITKDGTIGRGLVVDENDFVILSSLGLIRCDENRIDSFYLLYYLLSGLCIDQMYSHIRGSGITRLTIKLIKDLLTVIPPLSEQTQIVEYLDEKTQKIDSTIEKETKRIELLKEYRQSLISEVVTGKIDVRDWKE